MSETLKPGDRVRLRFTITSYFEWQLPGTFEEAFAEAAQFIAELGDKAASDPVLYNLSFDVTTLKVSQVGLYLEDGWQATIEATVNSNAKASELQEASLVASLAAVVALVAALLALDTFAFDGHLFKLSSKALDVAQGVTDAAKGATDVAKKALDPLPLLLIAGGLYLYLRSRKASAA